jgi:hypothetical protein
MILNQWAAKHGVSVAALAELRVIMGTDDSHVPANIASGLEAGVQQRTRFRAANVGVKLWRNNRGATPTPAGGFVRYGLANETVAMNERVKSSDLVGIWPVLVQPQHLNTIIGMFVSMEIKRPGWVYSGTPDEVAQNKWHEIVVAAGGWSRFVSNEQEIFP